jgi:hypothetical protein
MPLHYIDNVNFIPLIYVPVNSFYGDFQTHCNREAASEYSFDYLRFFLKVRSQTIDVSPHETVVSKLNEIDI